MFFCIVDKDGKTFKRECGKEGACGTLEKATNCHECKTEKCNKDKIEKLKPSSENDGTVILPNNQGTSSTSKPGDATTTKANAGVKKNGPFFQLIFISLALAMARIIVDISI